MIRRVRQGKKEFRGLRGDAGFTLVEIIVALGLTGLVLAAVYKTLSSQQKVFTVQEQAVEMQENMRASIDLMVRDLRHAGCDPLGTGKAGMVTATASTLRFTMDIIGGESDNIDNDGNGIKDAADPDEFADGLFTGTDEDLTYALMTDSDGVQCIGRNNVPVGRYVQALQFLYTLANGTQTATPSDPNDVRLVQIAILARNAVADKNYKNTSTYDMPSGTLGPYNDGYRRRLVGTVVRLRNMGFRQ